MEPFIPYNCLGPRMAQNPTREQLILSHLPQVERWVKGFVSKNPDCSHLFDDLLGESNLRLVKVVNQNFRKFHSEFDGNYDKFSVYVRLSIYSAMADFLRFHGVVRIPQKDGGQCEQLKDDERVIDWRAADAPDPDINLVLSTLFDCLTNKKDIAIVQTRLDGAKTIKAIVERTGIPRSTVKRRLQAILTRYKAKKDE